MRKAKVEAEVKSGPWLDRDFLPLSTLTLTSTFSKEET